LILIDTSAWIAFFRDRGPFAERVDRALFEGDASICGPVQTELRRGIKTKSERAQVLLHLAGCADLSQPANLWEEAGELGFALARRGITAKTLDLLIACYALAHHVPLLTTDQDFARIRSAGIPLLLA
jgi:predicted nucleic acid-binding protein